MKTGWVPLAALLALGVGPAIAQETQRELLVFGNATLARTSNIDFDATDAERQTVAADIIASMQRASFKIFGEYLLTNHEADLERLQIGWEPSDRSVVWLGRFHQPGSVWNTQHHHGQFLQTSITRPASEEWEDEQGVIPQHFVGALWEASWHLGGSRGLKTAIGGGIAPVMNREGLKALDLLDPNMHRRKQGFQARIAYLPDELDDSGFGLLLAQNKIAWDDANPSLAGVFDHIDQSVVGVYGSHETHDWKVQAVAYHVTARLTDFASAGQHNSFTIGYVQAEHTFPHELTLYARHEDSADTASSTYLQLFPEFVKRRSTLGMRWQFARSHALSFEASNSDAREKDFQEFRLQWSGALL